MRFGRALFLAACLVVVFLVLRTFKKTKLKQEINPKQEEPYEETANSLKRDKTFDIAFDQYVQFHNQNIKKQKPKALVVEIGRIGHGNR
jgi:heme/copper-type cytochrome/quinol oxidase subunit 1